MMSTHQSKLMEDIIPTFASPLSRDDNAPIGVLAAAFHKGVIRRLGNAVRGNPNAANLFDTQLWPMAEAMPLKAECWLPELGSALSRANTSPLSAVAHGLLALHVLGLHGEWECQLDIEDSYSIQGTIFALSGSTKVACTGDHLSIVSETGHFSFTRQKARWTPDAWNDARKMRLPSFFSYRDMDSTYAQGWLDPTMLGVKDPIVEWPPKALPEDYSNLPNEAAAGFDDVFAVLEESGPYLSWIKPLFRGIAVSPPVGNGHSYSSSHVSHPGVFSCVYPYRVEQLGEVTIHEMSHQYFLLLNAIFPLTHPDHDRLYYSSLKGKPRTLDRVFLAYHASANMSLYWHDRLDVAGRTDERQEDFEIMVNHTRDLTKQLDSADGLTDAGLALYHTQRSLIAERSII